MGVAIDTVTVDCGDPARVGTFWAEALGWRVAEQDAVSLEIVDPEQRDRPIQFWIVPEAKAAKNRWHLDLRPTRSMDAEVERLVALGAQVQGRIDEGGSFWTVMKDPEGNEFCVLRGPDDGWRPE